MLISNHQVRHVLGPRVILQAPGYDNSKCKLCVVHQPGGLNRFEISLHDAFIEYLDLNTLHGGRLQQAMHGGTSLFR